MLFLVYSRLHIRPSPSPSDISLVQSDINCISSWISSHYLTVNTSKTKYMFVSFKPSSFFCSFPFLYLNDSPIDQVTSFKYSGVLISSNLSWSPHILPICRKSRKLIGILYRLFYRHTSPPALFKLYSTQICPHLEYCSSIWDPSSSATISHLANSSPSNSVLNLGLLTTSLFYNFLTVLFPPVVRNLSLSLSLKFLMVMFPPPPFLPPSTLFFYAYSLLPS